MTWAKWIGKWHRARADRPRRAVCGANLSVVVDERTAPPIAERCSRCANWRFCERD